MHQLAEKPASENVKVSVFSATVFPLGYTLEPNAIKSRDCILQFTFEGGSSVLSVETAVMTYFHSIPISTIQISNAARKEHVIRS
jgi:hypothetical protein